MSSIIIMPTRFSAIASCCDKHLIPDGSQSHVLHCIGTHSDYTDSSVANHRLT